MRFAISKKPSPVTLRNRVAFAGSMLVLGVGLICMGGYRGNYARGDQTIDPNWSELLASMERMHMAMGAVKRSGKTDLDFVELMIPHHQGAIDMAKTELLHGKDSQMRRLAQEI